MGGTQQWMVCFMQNPMKMEDFGGFWGIPVLGNLHVMYNQLHTNIDVDLIPSGN